MLQRYKLVRTLQNKYDNYSPTTIVIEFFFVHLHHQMHER
jgi:hypothetical protein